MYWFQYQPVGKFTDMNGIFDLLYLARAGVTAVQISWLKWLLTSSNHTVSICQGPHCNSSIPDEFKSVLKSLLDWNISQRDTEYTIVKCRTSAVLGRVLFLIFDFMLRSFLVTNRVQIENKIENFQLWSGASFLNIWSTCVTSYGPHMWRHMVHMRLRGEGTSWSIE